MVQLAAETGSYRSLPRNPTVQDIRNASNSEQNRRSPPRAIDQGSRQ